MDVDEDEVKVAKDEDDESDPGKTVKTESSKSDSKKRKTPEAEPEAEEDEDDEEPVTKRPRRADKSKPGKVAVDVVKKATNGSTPKSKQSGSSKEKAQDKVKEPDDAGVAAKVKVEAPEKQSPSRASESASESENESDEDEVEAKPEVVAKARKKVQATLVGSAKSKDLYPDWKAGDPVPYSALCTTFSAVEMTTKRLIIMDYCSRFLRQVMRLTPSDLLPTVQLMINKLAADYQGIELGIGESLIMKAIGEATGRSLNVIKADQNEIGDLGLVAVKSRSNQPTMFKPRPLTVRGVLQQLMKIATTQGSGSQQKKVDEIKKLLSASDVATAGKSNKGIDITKDKGGPSESKFIVRFLEGKLRLGLAERTVLTSLASAVVIHEAGQEGKNAPSAEKIAEGEAILKTVYSELPNYGVIIPQMVEHGIFKLAENCKLQPGVPLKPMLAKPTKSITEVLDRFEGKSFTCEYKYDGERAQIHFVDESSPEAHASGNAALHFPGGETTLKKASKGISAIFSRNSEDLSKKYPDVLEKLHTWVKPETKSFVLDCETVAWDVAEKKVLPFQQLMTRKRKDVKAEDVKVKVCVYAFDMLYYNGEVSVSKSVKNFS